MFKITKGYKMPVNINGIYRSCLTILAAFLIVSFAGAGHAFSQEMAYPGEELFYEVSFLGVKLGSIMIITVSQEKLDGKPVYKTKGYIDTYKGIPFVDMHTIFESWIDTSFAFSHKFNGHWKDKSDDGRVIWDFDELLFDYKNGQIKAAKWKEDDNFFRKTFKTNKKWNDGLSLFFFARRFSGISRGIRVPTIMDKDTVSTTINFRSKRENVEIDAVKYPIKTVYLDGTANWTGIYGLKGYFQGWFSDDEAHIPIRAKMNVYVGNINIELVSWKRGDWVPPKARI
jgi:hypothetical protein